MSNLEEINNNKEQNEPKLKKEKRSFFNFKSANHRSSEIKTDKKHLIYILPNLFTAGSCFLGIISITASVNENFTKALIYIFLSLVLDGLDGRIARLTNTTSKFGAEFDSLADVIAFGAAPAVYFYCAVGAEFGRFGALSAAIFVVFGAIRLARFNITNSSNEPNVFIGLPIPIAAFCLVLWVKLYLENDFFILKLLISLLIIVLGLLMVSNIRYPSFKKVKFQKSYSMKILVSLIVFFSIFYLQPLLVSLFMATSYVVYGVLRAIYYFFIAKSLKTTK